MRRKSKVVVNDRFMQDMREYNKQMKRFGLKPKTLDEYILYRKGKAGGKPKLIKDPFKATTYIRPSPVVPSAGMTSGSCAKKPEMVYTGDKLMGIATMHKSNMVPVFKAEDAVEISKMRR